MLACCGATLALHAVEDEDGYEDALAHGHEDALGYGHEDDERWDFWTPANRAG